MKSLSDGINSTAATVSRYLSSSRAPDLEYVVRLAEYFGVPIDWLLGFGDDKYAPLPKDQQELLNLYAHATDDDRKVIHAVLNKYR